jgi:hypothetical protein
MEGALLTLAVLACPVGMGLMMWFMGKGMRGKSDRPPAADLDDLRTEHERLGDEIRRLEEVDARDSEPRVVGR